MDTEIYRTARKRFWASLVDWVVFLPLALVGKWLYFDVGNVSLIVAFVIVTSFLPFFYSVFMHYKYGYTIGKWVVKIKVLDVSETRPITFKQAFLRDAVYIVAALAGFLYYLVLAVQNNEPAYLYNDYDSFAGLPLLIWSILEIITMLFNEKRRALHDFLAKTVVVRMPN